MFTVILGRGGAEIHVDLQPHEVILEVSDQGCGIPSHVLTPIKKNGTQSGVGWRACESG